MGTRSMYTLDYCWVTSVKVNYCTYNKNCDYGYSFDHTKLSNQLIYSVVYCTRKWYIIIIHELMHKCA